MCDICDWPAQLSIEKVPRRADFWAEPLRSSVSLRVSVVALAKADVTGLLSPSLLFEEVPSRVWHDLSRAHAARKYSKCSDFIPPDVLALGTVHSIASRDGGQGSQFCVPFTKLLPPPLWTGSQPGGECPPVLGATSSARAGGAAPAAAA
ncbi:hypothetical protein T492DRAFT_1003096 [Pavlovales sp. CCMP2436]|nr:hypothetical protein T492DRAFT_1003096 [Pavlovales sp. CCMP2436]